MRKRLQTFLIYFLVLKYILLKATHKTMLIVLCMAFSLALMCDRCNLDVYFELKNWFECTMFEQFKYHPQSVLHQTVFFHVIGEQIDISRWIRLIADVNYLAAIFLLNYCIDRTPMTVDIYEIHA